MSKDMTLEEFEVMMLNGGVRFRKMNRELRRLGLLEGKDVPTRKAIASGYFREGADYYPSSGKTVRVALITPAGQERLLAHFSGGLQ
jgi:hypothetical protein